MQNGSGRARFWGIGLVVVAAIVAAGVYLLVPNVGPQPAANAATAPTAVPVSVAVVEPRNVALWDEFSGRLEAVERVDVRSRVAGAIDAVHFREGARVAKGDVLISLDPAPYAAEVARAEAQVAAAQAHVALTKTDLERGKQLWDSRAVSQRAREILDDSVWIGIGGMRPDLKLTIMHAGLKHAPMRGMRLKSVPALIVQRHPGRSIPSRSPRRPRHSPVSSDRRSPH